MWWALRLDFLRDRGEAGFQDFVDGKVSFELGDVELALVALLVNGALLPSGRSGQRVGKVQDWLYAHRMSDRLSTFGCPSISESSESCSQGHDVSASDAQQRKRNAPLAYPTWSS